MAQRFTERDTEVIKRAQQKRRSVLHLREDRDWLSDYATDPRLLLSRMAQRGALVALGGGRYAIATLGDASAARLPRLNLLDADLAPLGPYYLGFWSALNEHRLTDVDSPALTVAIGFDSGRVQRADFEVAGAPVRATRMRSDLMDVGIETIRISRSERYRRSDVERTLVDCLQRRRLAGSSEIVLTAWGRALAGDQVRWDVMVSYAERLGATAYRRVAALGRLAGQAELVAECLPARNTSRARLLSLSGDAVAIDGAEIDSVYRVALTPDRERIEGWLSYGK